MYSVRTSSGGCQIKTGTEDFQFTVNGNYKSIMVIMASKFTSRDGTWSGNAVCTVTHNGASLGSFNTTTNTSKSGFKGHYWGTTEGVTNMHTFTCNVSNGDTVRAYVSSSSRTSKNTITVILGE